MMLTAVKEIGELVIEREGREPLEILVEDPNANGRYKNVAAIVFAQQGERLEFAGVEQEEYETVKKMRYLYKSGAANGPDFSPTAKLTAPEKTFPMKVSGWFRVLDEKTLVLSPAEKVFLETLRELLKKNGPLIVERLSALRKQTPKKEGIFVTLKIRQGSESKYVGDFPVFRRLLKEQVQKKDFKIFAENKVCSVCGRQKSLVLGDAGVYSFYTEDKIGYIASGFDEKRTWRNFPVCPDCKQALEEGKKYVEEYLSFRFSGLPYYLIPRLVAGKEGVAEEILDIFRDGARVVSLRKQAVDRITGDEEDILYYLKDARDTLTLNFLFLQKIQAAERILLLIQDVFPSRLRTIFAAKRAVDEIFADTFTFRTLRNFFARSDPNKRNYDLDAYYLDTTDRIFKDRPVDLSFLLHFVMHRIRQEFISDGYFHPVVKEGLMVVTFLEKLKLIKMEEEEMEKRIFDPLFEKYGPTFAVPLKRGLFLLGALTELLLRKQYKERGAKPFQKNLKSLKMNEVDFKGLLPRIQNKLEEYDSFDKGKRLLAAEAAHYLLAAGDNWRLPVDEQNFYFAAGMNLAGEVAGIIYPGQEADDGEENSGEED